MPSSCPEKPRSKADHPPYVLVCSLRTRTCPHWFFNPRTELRLTPGGGGGGGSQSPQVLQVRCGGSSRAITRTGTLVNGAIHNKTYCNAMGSQIPIRCHALEGESGVTAAREACLTP